MALLDLPLRRIHLQPGTFASILARAAGLYRQRAALRRLDDRALDDIGVTRTEAAIEASRPVWDVPATWRD